MAEVINASTEKLTNPPSPNPNPTDSSPATSPPPLQQQQPNRRGPIRERDFRDREFDRRPRREYENRDRDRSPPPPPLPHREQQRGGYNNHQKRGRLSSSPPPPPYNNRGPRRSPPFKRRRDNNNNNNNNGYDGRRGSSPHHRGGFGGRRFGHDNRHDNPGGYEREGGGRPGYPDERSRGRLMGRLSGPYHGGPDWDSGPGGYSDAFNAGGTQRDGMMSYKQFIQELEDDILPAEAERRYQEYKTEFISTQKRNYFNSHKDQQWLKDKYHPTNLVAVIERRNEVAKKLAKDFQFDLHSGTLDLGPSFKPSFNKAEHSSQPNSDDEAEMGGKRKRPVQAGAKSDSSSAPQTHPVSSEPRRIHIDVVQTQSLVRKLDLEKGIEDNVLCRADDRPSRDKSHGSSSGPVIIIRGSAAIKGLEGIELLDTLLTYLWRVHGVDYYGLVESSEPKGLRHVRATGKNSEASNSSAKEWENKLDSRWQERMKGSDPLEVMTGKEKLDAAAAEALDPYVRKIRDEKYGWKYGCGAKGCTKLFHASEFVQKHLKLKHPELLTEVTSKVREELYFQNYMNDEHAPGAAPIMQPSFPKEKTQRRRPGIETRIRDDRGNNRNGNEWFDRSDNAQSGDFNKDRDPGNNQDEPMFDTFGAPVGVFGSDMAPPMLMPVPGAGPLGPFVPAPPEVAMRMFRDQGGPSPFEGGRNGRSGPQLTGPGPIIGMPSNFRQDPRRLRSYNDLDAPDDEVTVIDYRSL